MFTLDVPCDTKGLLLMLTLLLATKPYGGCNGSRPRAGWAGTKQSAANATSVFAGMTAEMILATHPHPRPSEASPPS